MFSHLSSWQLHNCVLKSSEQGSLFPDDQFEGSHAYIYSQNECFPIYLLGNCINECWNPQNRACFCKTIDLRGHMPRFTLKMNVLLSISLETPKMSVETLRTGLIFPRWLIWGVTCLGLLSRMNVLPSISLETPKMCVETLRTGLVFWWSIWGVKIYLTNEHFPIYLLGNPICEVTCLFYDLLEGSQKWMNVFPSISLDNPRKSVLKPFSTPHVIASSQTQLFSPKQCLHLYINSWTWMFAIIFFSVNAVYEILRFPRWSIWGHMPRFTSAKWTLSHLSP